MKEEACLGLRLKITYFHGFAVLPDHQTQFYLVKYIQQQAVYCEHPKTELLDPCQWAGWL